MDFWTLMCASSTSCVDFEKANFNRKISLIIIEAAFDNAL